MNLTIREIIEAVNGTVVLSDADKIREDEFLNLQVTGVEIDSRLVPVGGVFVAEEGERTDAHKYIGNVYKAGALLTICRKSSQQVAEKYGAEAAENWGSYILTEDPYEAMRRMAECYRSKLDIPVIGITGSVGKTSTKEFISAVLSQGYNVFKTKGNYNNEIGVALTLLSIREEHTVAVVEMGINHFGEMHKLAKMAKPDICVITNIGDCHLEFLGDREGVRRAKTEMFDYMDYDCDIILNGEDELLSELKTVLVGKLLNADESANEETEIEDSESDTIRPDETLDGQDAEYDGEEEDICGSVVTPHFFGKGGNPAEEVYVTDIVSKGMFGSEAALYIGDERLHINVPLPGEHMVLNAAAAADVAMLLGLSDEEIIAGIEAARPTPGRFYPIKGDNITIINDCYNANPASMKAAVDTLCKATPDPKVVILGDMFELGAEELALHEEVGEHVASKLAGGGNVLICIGERCSSMYDAACGTVVGELEAFYYAGLELFLEDLKTRRQDLIPEGSTVLVKASHSMKFEQIIEALQIRE